MPLRKHAAGARFEVALEANSLLLGGKLDRDNDPPWSVRNGVAAWTVVVPLQSLVNVSRRSDVMMRRINFASEDVNEASSDSLHG